MQVLLPLRIAAAQAAQGLRLIFLVPALRMRVVEAVVLIMPGQALAALEALAAAGQGVQMLRQERAGL
jgi:hypothetical protein